MEVKSSKSFVFNGLKGFVFPDGFVKWGGMSFHKQCAKPELLKAIETAGN